MMVIVNTQGLMFLHNRGRVHRDMKSLNLLVTSTWEVKVGWGFTNEWSICALFPFVCISFPLSPLIFLHLTRWLTLVPWESWWSIMWRPQDPSRQAYRVKGACAVAKAWKHHSGTPVAPCLAQHNGYLREYRAARDQGEGCALLSYVFVQVIIFPQVYCNANSSFLVLNSI